MKKINTFIAILFVSVYAHASFIIPNGGVTTSKIANSAVTTAKINSGAVTLSKLASPNIVYSSSSGTFSTSSTSFVDVTNLSVSITTSGRPVFVGLIPDATTSPAIFGDDNVSHVNNFIQQYLQILRGSTVVAAGEFTGVQNAYAGPKTGQNFFTIDVPSAGSYTYKVQTRVGDIAAGAVKYWKLVAFEM